MSIQSITTPAPSQDLTTVATVVEEMEMTCTPAQLRTLERKITSVSSQIRNYCHRPFGEERVTMNIKSYGSTQLMLERFPIVEIHSVAFDGEPVTDFSIDDRGAGFLYRRNGWVWTTGEFAGGFPGGAPRVAHPHPGSEEALYTVDVTAGYVLSSFPSGFTPNANSVDLPAEIEEAALITVKDAYANRGGPGGARGEVSSVKTTGVAISYAVRTASAMSSQVRAATALPVGAVALLTPHVVIK